MNFLLKIVEGPNKGAEIALVTGVAVTLGKGDDCDIVLADPTLPDEPISLEASDDGVTENGEPLEQFAVKTAGATSFAVGPADAPWGALKWPEKAGSKEPGTEGRAPEGESREPKAESQKPKDGSREEEGAPKPESDDGKSKKKHGGWCGCLVVLVALLLVMAGLAWFYRAAIRDFCKSKGYDISGATMPFGKTVEPTQAEKVTLATIAERYGLSVEESDGTAKVSGNFRTRAERLRAGARPGAELDLSDDESFRAAADDALFTLTEGALKVIAATNRTLSIGGVSRSAESLRRTLRALGADLQKLRSVDVAGVVFGVVPRHDPTTAGGGDDVTDVNAQATPLKPKKTATPLLPVCGILTKPYPCLVMRDGSRVLEGAPLGGNVVLKIDADEVVVTNSMGRFVWRP